MWSRGLHGAECDPPRVVFLAFLKLGLIAFGGPIAHIGYFRDEFVTRRRWLNDAAYGDLVALCQFLPGPTSSQVGFAIGLLRAGYLGGLAAWTGFSLPSSLALVLFAYGAPALTGPVGVGLRHGLQLVAVVIVAQAVFGMARMLCPDRQRALIAALAAGMALYSGSSAAQIGAILLGGAAGYLACRSSEPVSAAPLRVRVSHRAGIASLAAYTILLVGLPLYRSLGAPPSVIRFDAFYQAGALVFGGGHVVLPLLRDAFVMPGWISDDAFLAGYGAAQAVPGPLFTFAAYLGAAMSGSLHGFGGAVTGLVGIFLPGFLVLVGTLPFWDTMRTGSGARAAMSGINASVVGLLGAALYSPVCTSTLQSTADFAAALIGFGLLTLLHVRPLLVVIAGALAGVALNHYF